MHKSSRSSLPSSKSPESRKKLVLQTPKHKHTNSLITPKASQSRLISTITSSSSKSRTMLSLSKFSSPNTQTAKSSSKHKHTFSDCIPLSAKNSKLIKRKAGLSPDKRLVWKTVKLPLTSESALKQFSSYLSPYESTEILSFAEIYFLAHSIAKTKLSSVNNSGFDDDKGDYKIIIGDHIAYRYEIKTILGKGSFGQVVKVFDHKDKIELAVKIIKNRPRFHQQAVEEIEILKYLKEKDLDSSYSIVHIKDHFIFRKHAIIIFELLSIDLYQFIKLAKFRGLSQHLIRKFAVQILQALRLCDRYKIIHCDLKPENILLTSSVDTNLKVIDFGSACFYDKRMYTYIQSRFYRAPEIILGLAYTTSIDMWSFGCILVELYTGRPVFPGESEIDQIQCMMEVLGMPEISMLRKGTRVKVFFDDCLQPKVVANSKGRKRIPGAKKLCEVLLGAEEGFVDLVAQCLEWDYHKRITPDEALMHEWMQESCPTPTSKRRLKHTRTTSDTSFLKIPQRFDKLSNYIEGPANL